MNDDSLQLWRNARIALCDERMQTIEPGALLVRNAVIEWVGRESELPTYAAQLAATHDVSGRWITPGLIDCHTHLVFAGNRADEHAERLRGVSYEVIARRGGGILSTVRAVRAASESQLFDASVPRLQSLMAEGVTTIEIKSGYGLTLADEAKMLRVARQLAQTFSIRVRTTLLAAHTTPPEYAGRADEYVNVIAQHWLPALHEQGLVDAVDVFCERIGFTAAQSAKLFDAAAALDIPVKMHAEQLSNLGGTLLAAQRQALSCDHLEYASDAEAQAMATSGTVAVLLPIAYYVLAENRKPPINALRAAGTRMAVATDCNPGTSPSASLLLAMSMATRLFALTTEEALAGVTCNAARALGIHEQCGTLAAGYVADFVIWDIDSLAELSYWLGFNRCHTIVRAGIAS